MGIPADKVKFIESVSANREPFIQQDKSVTGSTPAENIRTNYPDAQLTEFDVYSKCAEALKNSQVQAVTTDNVILLGLISQDPEAFELVGKPFTEEPYGIGLKKGDSAFRGFINDTLDKLYQDGRWKAAWDATAGKVATRHRPHPPSTTTDVERPVKGAFCLVKGIVWRRAGRRC